MKLSDLTGGVARTLQEADLAYPCSSLADRLSLSRRLSQWTFCRFHRRPYGSLDSPQQQSYSIEHPAQARHRLRGMHSAMPLG